MESIGMDILKGLTFIYDATTLPIYFICQRPWKKKNKSKIKRSSQTSSADNNSSATWTRLGSPTMTLIDDCQFIEEVLNRSVEKYQSNKCFGTRNVLVEEQEKCPDGTLALRKTLTNEYKWLNYNQVNTKINELVIGLTSIGINHNDNVLIFMETRIEWMIVCQSLWRLNGSVVPITIYPTTEETSLINVINENQVKHIITSSDLLIKIKRVINKLNHNLINLIYVEDHLDKVNLETIGLDGVNCLKLNGKLELIGNKNSKISPKEEEAKERSPNDTALIMYTSGTSGTMKGVKLSHVNLIEAIKSMTNMVNLIKLKSAKDVSVNYLPLSSSFELIMEHVLLITGIPIAYSSPSTLTNVSPSLKDGTIGDINLINPVMLTGVPLILDRLKKGINEQVALKGSFFGNIFNFAIDYKQYWMKKGYTTPIVNSFLCSKIRSSIGGNVSTLLLTGSPLSSETQSFAKTCLNINILQGYGTTETLNCVTFMDPKDASYGKVGPPLFGVKLKLRSWKSFTPHDKPNPRGEVLVSGNIVCKGYVNEKDEKENFLTENNIKWFKTGDIGEIFPDGTLRIIDRKNLIVTLDTGDVIMIGKIEADLKSCPYVDHICIIAEPSHNFLIGLISPNHESLRQLCCHLGIEDEMNYKDMCNDPEIQSEVIKAISEHGLRSGLKKSEIPRKIKLCYEPWTTESGLVTSTLTVRRDKMVSMYQKDINRMFGITDLNRNVFDVTRSDVSRGSNQVETRVDVERSTENDVKIQMEKGNGNSRSRMDSVDDDEDWKEAEMEQSYM